MKHSGFFGFIWLQIWNISRGLFCGKHFGKPWGLFIKKRFFFVNNSVIEMEITDSYWAPKNLFSIISIEVALWQGKLWFRGVWDFMLRLLPWGFISLVLSSVVLNPFMIRALSRPRSSKPWSEQRPLCSVIRSQTPEEALQRENDAVQPKCSLCP